MKSISVILSTEEKKKEVLMLLSRWQTKEIIAIPPKPADLDNEPHRQHPDR